VNRFTHWLRQLDWATTSGELVLVAAAIATWIVYGRSPSNSDESNVALALAGNCTTAAFLLLVVERMFRQRANRDRDIRRRVAARALRIPLVQHFRLLFDMYKAASAVAQSPPFPKPGAFLRGDFSEVVRWLEVGRAAPVVPPKNWAQHLTDEFGRFHQELVEILTRYGDFLDAHVIQLVDELINSSMMLLGTRAAMMFQMQSQYGQVEMFNIEDVDAGGLASLVSNYCDTLARTLEAIEHEWGTSGPVITAQDWSTNVSPQVGDSRLQTRRQF